MPLARQCYGRALEEASLRGFEVVAPMQQEAVVPHEYVADAPLVAVDEARLGREGRQFDDQRAAFLFRHTNHADRRRGVEVERLAAGHRMRMNEWMGDVRRL